MKNLKKTKASITLTLVIVISSILLLAGLTLVLTTVDLSNSSKISTNLNLAIIRSRSCIDESLYRLKLDVNYTGSTSVTFSDGNCTSTTANSGTPNLKTLTVVSTVNGFSYQTTKSVDTSVSPFTISN